MNYERAYEGIRYANNHQEMEAAIQSNLYPGEISYRLLAQAMERQFPGEQVMITDREEQRRREAASQSMQIAMSSLLRSKYEAIQLQKAVLDPGIQLDRPLSEDTMLNLPHPEQIGEYTRRYNILAHGTTQEKTDLMMGLFHDLKDRLNQQGWTRDRLRHMNNMDLANNFEGLKELMGWAGATVTLSNSSQFNLTEDQKQELRDFASEYDVMPWIDEKMRVISNPYFSSVRMEQLPKFEGMLINEEDLVEEEDTSPEEVDQARKALKELFLAAEGCRNQLGDGLLNEVEHHLNGVFNEDIEWLDDQGNHLKAEKSDRQERADKYVPPLQGLGVGRQLIAVLPNGTKKTFSMVQYPDGGMDFNLETQPLMNPTTNKRVPLYDHMDQRIAAALPQLAEQLEQGDPWYVKSSKEFKNMKAALETVRKEWKAFHGYPTPLQKEKLQRQMEALQATSQAYIDLKRGNHDLGKNGPTRLAAANAISFLARQQLANLRELDQIEASRENAREREVIEGARSEEARARQQNSITDQQEEVSRFQRGGNDAGVKRTTRANIVQLTAKANELKRIPCEPSAEAGDALKELHRSVIAGMEPLMAAATMERIQPDKMDTVKRNMAELTLFHLIMQERGPAFDGHAGPLEKALHDRGRESVTKCIKNHPDFKRNIEPLTGTRLNDFIMNDGAREIGREIIKTLHPQQNQAQQPVAQKAAQNAGPKPMQK